MANTYSQLYAHLIFSPLGRENLITSDLKEDIYKYITGIIKNKGQKPFIINGTADHIHIFIGFLPDVALSWLVRDIKSNSTNFIKNHLGKRNFSWQTGFGAFSYQKAMVPTIVKYIQNQEDHHKIKSFRSEYVSLLKKAGIEYDEKYLFEWYE